MSTYKPNKAKIRQPGKLKRLAMRTPPKNGWGIQVLAKRRQLLFLIWHLPFFSYSSPANVLSGTEE